MPVAFAITAGTPVKMNRRVVEADLRILIGFVKPHSMAGYSGGGKTILPGVCGVETIATNHGYAASMNPFSVVGVIDGFRWCLLGGESQLYLPGFLVSLGVVIFFLWFGIHYFRRRTGRQQNVRFGPGGARS